MGNIRQLDLNECYGCTACSSVCPKEAITMLPSNEGFLYPNIDNELCVDCSLCLKVCNIQNNVLKRILNDKPKRVYAAWNKNHSDIMTSTSGGIATMLSKTLFNKGFSVYGAIFDSQNNVTHIKAKSEDDIERMKGSKYVQSNIVGIFKEVKKDLDNNIKVLIIGTPCQIGGLKSYLKSDCKNLYTIDLVCHGVPSAKMFSSYIHYIENEMGQPIREYTFRKKKESGWRPYEGFILKSGKSIVRTSGIQSYALGFYNNYFSRESCYHCVYSQPQRVGDITLSDFWGAENVHKELRIQRKYGFNYLGINTEKGNEMFSMIQKEIDFVESSLDVAISGDHRFVRSDYRPIIRSSIYKILEEKGYSYIAKSILKKRRSIKSYLLPIWFKNLVREIQSRLV